MIVYLLYDGTDPKKIFLNESNVFSYFMDEIFQKENYYSWLEENIPVDNFLKLSKKAIDQLFKDFMNDSYFSWRDDHILELDAIQ